MATILRHEQVHSQQGHSLDWLLVRLISALFWFNPMMRYWQRAIAMNHEYIADAQTVNTTDTSHYAHLLVNLATHSNKIATLHFSSYGQLKSRIIMLHQIRTKAIHRMRFCLVAPLVVGLLVVVSCGKSLENLSIAPSISPVNAFRFNDLVGTWTNTNRTTINNNDGKTPRDFPERAGDIRACLSTLVLSADGNFQMLDEQRGQRYSGIWQSDNVGVAVQLQYVDPTDKNAPLVYNRDGARVRGPLLKTISLNVTSLKAGKMEAWQYYPSSTELSGGQVYYEYQKQ